MCTQQQPQRQQQRGRVDPRCIAWNRQLTRRNVTVDEIGALVRLHGPEFNDVNTATALNQLGKRDGGVDLVRRDAQVQDVLVAAVRRTMGEMGARELANSAHGLAKMGLERGLVGALAECFAEEGVARSCPRCPPSSGAS